MWGQFLRWIKIVLSKNNFNIPVWWLMVLTSSLFTVLSPQYNPVLLNQANLSPDSNIATVIVWVVLSIWFKRSIPIFYGKYSTLFHSIARSSFATKSSAEKVIIENWSIILQCNACEQDECIYYNVMIDSYRVGREVLHLYSQKYTRGI